MPVNSLTSVYNPSPSHGGMVEILLVEDNPGDVRLLMEALNDRRHVRLYKNLNVVGDGIEAMDFLHRQGKHAGAARPDLILLDLNLPKKDGREVLAEIKQDPSLKRIPVVVLTTSNAKQDILKAYDLHANCYITKPVDLEHFFNLVRAIEDFWLSVVKLPSE